jgi:hypothetical protein
MLEKLDERAPQVGRFAWVMAWVGLVVGQLHALARFRTADGLEDIDPDNYPLTAAWAVPADDALSPLLDWGDPDLVYVTYGKVWVLVFLATTLCALVVYRRRQPPRFEKWVWRVNLALLAAVTVGVTLSYGLQWTGDYEGEGIEAALFEVGTWFDFLGLGLLLITVTALGVTLLVKRFRPVLPAVLLALFVPLVFGITQVTSLGSGFLPIAFAFGILGRRLARTADLTRPRVRQPTHA